MCQSKTACLIEVKASVLRIIVTIATENEVIGPAIY
jgi:hypothetical protein